MSDISQNATRYDTSNTQRVDIIGKNNGQVYSGSGNTTKIGFDCSGYFYHVMRESGYDIERLTARGYLKSNKFYDVSSNNIRPGDMINFGNHIGIVTSYDPETGLGKFKHMRGSNNKGSLKDSEFSTNPENPRDYGTNRPIKAIRRINEDNYDSALDLHKNGGNPEPVLQPIPQNYEKQCDLQDKLNSHADNSPDNNPECVQAIREQTGVAIDEWSTILSGIGDEYVTERDILQDAIQSIKDQFNTRMDQLEFAARDIGREIVEISDEFSRKVDSLKEGLSNVFDGIVSGIKGTFDDTKTSVQEYIDSSTINVGDFVSASREALLEFAADYGSGAGKLLDVLGINTNWEDNSRYPGMPLGSIDTRSCHAKFVQGKSYLPPRDPIAIDLDGDGIETVAVGAGVLFDHNNDGIATGTGWVKSDDGLLVRDINNNGTIDSGRELFGDQTLLPNGAQAANGFAALRDLDSNADGKIDSSDAAFAELKIWRDLNQDGFSQADELISLADAGIAAINLDAVAKNQAQNGNTIASTGTYTKTDGTTGTTADVNLASDPSNRRFTDTVEIPETILDLPDMTGSGRVRDLQEAAALSPTLADALTRFGNAATRAEQMALLDELLLAWADTSGMAESLDERDPRYRVEYLSFGNVRRSDHMTGTTTASSVTAAPTNADDPHIDAAYHNLINQWNDKVHILEAFNGSYFFGLPGQSQDGGAAAIGMWVDYSGSTALSGVNKGKPGLTVNYAQSQLDMLNQAYQSLRNSVYDSLILQTRLKGYLDKIDLSITDTSIALDFTQLTQSLQDKLAVDPVNGLTDLIEFNKYTRELLSGTQWDGVAMMEETIRTLSATPELQVVYSDFGVRFNGAAGTGNDDIILGDEQARTIYGAGGSDTLLGGAGNETLVGGAGNDTISGGAGNDRLLGETGDDTYIFRSGSGNDTITDGQGNNSVLFSGLNPGDIRVTAPNLPYDDLLFTIVDTGETLSIASGWSLNWSSYEFSSVSSFIFADGTAWSKEDALRAAVELPTEGNDRIAGSRLSDSISGLGGNDTIIGRDGDDTMDGGSGDDLLIGSADIYRDYSTGQQRYYETVTANGNDTYLFGRGSGHDTIRDGDDTTNTDILRFAEDVAPDDVTIDRDGDNLVLTIGDTGDSVTIARYFYENVYTGLGHTFEIESERRAT